ncbi:elongation factor G [Oricola thermophila]|uniref:Elongation factor G n=1 Tax=Oricola thermophila TaxID=2742145 RepID=A0A6N1V867_9HYPH|nr:elongation factor G [Oricola thermophila]QKV17141.1 elongation factor G [Oricola thermophila]
MRCFSILGPSQSGKSTLANRLAALEGGGESLTTPNGLGVTEFSFLGETWCALDTPGSVEAIAQTLDALLASDACILCVSPDPNEAVLAAPHLRAIEASGTPCTLFINRIDEPKGRVRDIIAALQDYSNHPLVMRQVPIREGERIVGAVDLISERAWRYREGRPSTLVQIPEEMAEREHEARAELLEHLSEYDDRLLEELIEDQEPASEEVYAISARVLAENRVIPVMVGAAGNNNGMMRLMKALRHEAPPVDVLRRRLAGQTGSGDRAPAAACLHAFHRTGIGKTVLLRALEDGVKQGTQAGGYALGALRGAASDKTLAGAMQKAGQVVAAVKSDHLTVPSLVTADDAIAAPDWAEAPAPMLERILVPENERDETKLSGTLQKIAETDQGLAVRQEEGTGAQLVAAQGPLHMRQIVRTLAEVFNVPVSERPPSPAYRETITRTAEVHYRHRKQTGGAGQFADVKLTVRPNARGEGFTFAETVKGGAVPRNFIPAVEAGAREALARGPLGFQVVDVAVTLTDGQHHSVDSSDFAFRAAGRMGVAQALADAGAVLMQPIYRVEIRVPSVFSGSLVPIVSALKGQVLGFDRDEDARGWDIFRALMPGHALDELAHSLRSATQGIGWFSKCFDHFEELYGREADAIVRAHGAGKAA